MDFLFLHHLLLSLLLLLAFLSLLLLNSRSLFAHSVPTMRQLFVWTFASHRIPNVVMFSCCPNGIAVDSPFDIGSHSSSQPENWTAYRRSVVASFDGATRVAKRR